MEYYNKEKIFISEILSDSEEYTIPRLANYISGNSIFNDFHSITPFPNIFLMADIF